MDFGVAMFFTDYSMPAAALARAAEARGFESLWAPEHSHIPVNRRSQHPGGGELPKEYHDAMDPFISLTMAAAASTQLKIGTGVCLVIQRDPIQTAKLVASLDQVSGGRFLFGIGGGWNAEEIENHGTAFKTRFAVMRERVAAMKQIWTESRAEYHGSYVNFDPIMAWPKPLQKPHPPVIIGGGFPHGARRAAQWGDGWIPHRTLPGYQDVFAHMAEFHRMVDEAGRSRAAVPVTIWAAGADEAKLDAYRAAGVARVVLHLGAADGEVARRELDRWARLIETYH